MVDHVTMMKLDRVIQLLEELVRATPGGGKTTAVRTAIAGSTDIVVVAKSRRARTIVIVNTSAVSVSVGTKTLSGVNDGFAVPTSASVPFTIVLAAGEELHAIASSAATVTLMVTE